MGVTEMTASIMTVCETAPARSLRFDPQAGSLVLKTARGAASYCIHYGRDVAGNPVVVLGDWAATKKYRVAILADDTTRCDCPAGRYQRECKHRDAVSVLHALGRFPAFPEVETAKPQGGYATAESNEF
jgi:hypothetical protein